MPKSAAAQDWADDAACKPHRIPDGMSPDWFAVRDKWSRMSEKVPGEDDAKAICRTCPVRNECLEFALPQPVLEGTWGGLTESQRRAERRKRRRIDIAERGIIGK